MLLVHSQEQFTLVNSRRCYRSVSIQSDVLDVIIFLSRDIQYLLPDRVDTSLRYTRNKRYSGLGVTQNGKMVRTLSWMSDISVKLIVKRRFIVYYIRKGSIRCATIHCIWTGRETWNGTGASWRAESKRESHGIKRWKGGQGHNKCEIAKYDKDVLASTAGSLAVVTF